MIMDYSRSMPSKAPIPVVDLFAGPGGLGEGFSRVGGPKAFNKVFKTVISIEKDPVAVETLRLRALYRTFAKNSEKCDIPDGYLDQLTAVTNKQRKEAANKLRALKKTWKHIEEEVPLNLELGKKREETIELIKKRLGRNTSNWVLIGGPPCQAYSLVGRSRMRNHEGKKKDSRHRLYREYLEVVRRLKPAVFVMENVKGINSAKVDGERILPKIEKDLRRRIGFEENEAYELYALADKGDNSLDQALVKKGKKQKSKDYLVRAEQFGIPQTRHRVFIVGVRGDIKKVPELLTPVSQQVSLRDVISSLPALKGLDSAVDRRAYTPSETGDQCKLVSVDQNIRVGMPDDLRLFMEPVVPALCAYLLNHEARSHMSSDLKRYEWWAQNAKDKSPTLDSVDLPLDLKPAHSNLARTAKDKVFVDRFKVQLPDRPCGTITSHISKDGHYYIHYDPAQARSFSVREAARVQTFPDDYFFMGNRTQQYHQVGNAVPPYLAYQIGGIVARLLGR